jgi:hypothetical protein
VAVGVAVRASVAVGVGVAVLPGVMVGVGVGVCAGVEVALAVCAGVGDGVGVCAGVGVALWVGTGVGVGVADADMLLPLRDIFCGLRSALSVIETKPLFEAITLAGAKVISSVHILAAASAPTHWPDGTVYDPLAAIAVIEIGAVVPFFSVTGSADVEPTPTEGNFNLVALKVSTGKTAAPFKVTVTGLGLALLGMLSLPESLPATVGAKPRLNAH